MADEPDTTNAESSADTDSEKIEVSPVELPQVDSAGATPENNKDLNLRMILDIPVDIRVELGNTKLSIADVLKLGEGSIIELDRLAGHPADIIVNGKMIGEGDIVVVNDNFGIRITKLVAPEERLESI